MQEEKWDYRSRSRSRSGRCRSRSRRGFTRKGGVLPLTFSQPPANTTGCCSTGVIHYVVKSMLCSAKYFHSEKSMQNGLIERSFGKHVTKYVREWQRRQQQGPDRAMGRGQTGFAIFRPDIRNAGQNIPVGVGLTTRPPQK